MTVSERMRRQWNERARENAYYWVVSGQEQWTKEEYYREGEKDVARLVVPYLKSCGLFPEHTKTLSALDIGCGTGRLVRALADIFGSVTGIDISEEMIHRAKEENRSIMNAHFLLASGTGLLPVHDHSIDFCFSYMVFQHIPSKEVIRKYFCELLRVLKSGGLAKIQVRGAPGNPPGRVVWFKGFASFYLALTLWRGWLPLPWLRPYDTVYGACFTDAELKSTLMEVGFRQVETFRENDRYLWAKMRSPAPDHA
ncbi:MAG: class I SAM-dependent methyltransferase [Candidatus Peribacteraceae bacterium]|nr:class I SAM-dependent methyltransferase [Candidatus Peribacteraceae bacterium]